MSIYLRRLLLLFSLLAIGVAGPVQAKDWPSLPVKFVLPYPPGGASDVTARLLAERLGAMWKVPVTVENRPVITKPTPPSTASFVGPLDVSIDREDGGALTNEQRDNVKSCLRMVKPRPPVSVLLENINGMLYVSPRSPEHEILGSGDFRDCLKLRVQGKIATRSVLIKGTAKKVGP